MDNVSTRMMQMLKTGASNACPMLKKTRGRKDKVKFITNVCRKYVRERQVETESNHNSTQPIGLSQYFTDEVMI